MAETNVAGFINDINELPKLLTVLSSKQIFDNFVNYLSLFGKTPKTSFNVLNASNESNDNFCNLNYQTFHDEEELKLFYWTDYNSNQISNSNLNNFYTFYHSLPPKVLFFF